MGFFSSRKPEPTTSLPASGRDTLKVIRSKFYGKAKSVGKISPSLSAAPHAPSITHPPSAVCVSEAYVSNQSSPLSAGHQVFADTLTMSLAQRLNDLATANADGLLDDEEYRLLRQSLFERFATDADIPSPPTVVSPRIHATAPDTSQYLKRTPSVNSQRSISSAVSSLFRRATGRSTLSSAASTPGSIFLLQQTVPAADSVSVTSVYSRPSITSRSARHIAFPRPLSRSPSDESLISSSHAGSPSGSLTSDLRGVMSRRNIPGGGSTTYASSISSRATTRSTKPPSSFHLRHPTLRQSFSRTHEGDNDEDNPKTTTDLRQEIESVESEGRKLLDAFNGLELSILTKPRPSVSGGMLSPPTDPSRLRLSIYPENTTSSALGSAYTLIPDRTGLVRAKSGHGQSGNIPLVRQPISLKRKPSVVNSITGSHTSSTSDLRSNFLTTAPSSLHSTRSSPNLQVEKATSPALAVSNSVPGASSKKRPQMFQQKPVAPPSSLLSSTPPSAPPAHTTSGVRLPLSHHTSVRMDPALHVLETELADIRRRRADVSARYERRLEFLRAKLKAAEIRERLARK